MNTSKNSGHAKNVDNLNRLNQAIAAMGSLYNPANAAISAASLKKLQSDGQAVLNAINTSTTNWKDATNAREIGFDGLSKFCLRVQAAFQGSGATPQARKDVAALCKEIADASKLTKADAGKSSGGGTGTTPTPPSDGQATPPTAKAPTRHVGYDEKVNNFAKLVVYLQNQSIYKPNEEELSLAKLQEKLNVLRSLNDEVIESELSLDQARINRNTLFYQQDTGLLDAVKQSKAYVKSLQGGSSQMYKNFAAIRFVRVVPAKKAK
jgi:hypothetical protein